ncbi:Endochitinase [Nymphon striatum]|nr:Endochitinase [Nymphon striatum]
MIFIDGRFERERSSNLLPCAVPSVFDFSAHSVGSTDAPSTSIGAAAANSRSLRLQQRKERQHHRKVIEDIQDMVEEEALEDEGPVLDGIDFDGTESDSDDSNAYLACDVTGRTRSMADLPITTIEMSTLNNAKDNKRLWSGVHCIAPGCTNYYAKNNDVHYHRLPLKRPDILSRWLQIMKLLRPPVKWARVCSVHFVKPDYKDGKMTLIDGRFVREKTNNLLPGAVPSVFDFSAYSVGSTDAPSTSICAAAANSRRLRLQQRTERQHHIKVIEDILDLVEEEASAVEGPVLKGINFDEEELDADDSNARLDHSNDEAHERFQKAGKSKLRNNSIPTKKFQRKHIFCNSKRAIVNIKSRTQSFVDELDHSYASTVPYSGKANQVTSRCKSKREQKIYLGSAVNGSPFYSSIAQDESQPVDIVRVKFDSPELTNDEIEETAGNIYFPEEWLSCELRTETKEESSSTRLSDDTVRVKSGPLEPTNGDDKETAGNVNFHESLFSYELESEEIKEEPSKSYIDLSLSIYSGQYKKGNSGKSHSAKKNANAKFKGQFTGFSENYDATNKDIFPGAVGGNSFDDFFGKQTKTVTTTKITKSETTSHTGQSLGTHNYVDKGGYDIKTTYTKKGEAIIDFSYCLKPIGYFQHPLYCDLYLNCYDENAYVLKCPQNMFFDSVSNQCNLKDNVNCGSRQISTATTHEVKPSSSHVDKTVITSSSHQSTIKTTILDSGEAYIDFSYCLQPTGQFPHPEYCSLFLNCYNNRAYIQECPSDLFFNDAIKGCDYPNNVDCGSRWTTGASSVFTTSGSKVTTDHAGSSSSGSSITSGSHSGSETLITSESHQSIIKTFVTDSGEHYIDFSYCPQPTGQFPHPEYCSLFLNCYNNRAYIQECPSGLFFKDAIKGCDYPKNVDCGSRWKTGASSVFTTRKSKLATFDGGSYSSHTTITTTITKTGNIAGFYTWINPEC